MIPTWVQLAYLVAAIFFIVALKGLSSPRTARRGNLIGAAGAVIATAVVFAERDLDHVLPILVAVAVGSLVGVVGAQRVQMTQMPQLVALFNGVGGGAAALVALLELVELSERGSVADVAGFDLVATAFTIFIGSLSFSGSLVTFAKLQELMTTRPVLFPGLPVAFGGSLLAAIAVSVLLVINPALWTGVV
ncbi:MAG: NAD(P)(+) transhydrogenase (Re/Si-specific) subunit beta, partial [Actinomycetota bacterium]|nr:NAD(P)(+) transhydrogenase (Re/Si-specific) subunit beta [Actinomycetota bacterium]